VAFSADASTDAFRNKMNAVLASGDLPDIIRWGDRNFFNQAYDAGYLADITDVFETYATDSIKEYRVKYPDSFIGASFNDRLYAFPAMNDNFHQAPFLWIRDDWLENTGSTPPATVDEMVELARVFTYEDPDRNGIKDTFGFALNKNILASNYATICGLIGAYGVPSFGTGGIFYWGDDGTVKFANIQPEMKDVLSLVRDMYSEGLIDPEFVVKDTANMEEDVVNGKIGMTYHMNWGTWHPFNLLFESEGVMARPYPIPTVPGKDFKIGINSNKTGDLFLLNANCKNPEAFMKILNLYNNICIETTEPENFLRFWSDEQYRFCPVYVAIPTPELFADVLYEALNKGTPEGLPANLQQVYSYVVDFESGANTDPNAYGTWGQMNKRGSMIIAMEDYKGHMITNIMANVRPDIWMQNASILETMMITTFTDIITGAKPVDEFDKFVDDWLANGGRQTLDELAVLYPKD
jgi:putative aldouronate transport system substrate-binding protein